jgi:hypothetical protein
VRAQENNAAATGTKFSELVRRLMEPFIGAGARAKAGMVPAPKNIPAGQEDEYFIAADATWRKPGTGGGGGGIPSAGDSVSAATSFGLSSSAGSSSDFSRADHNHGTPADPGLPLFSDDETILGDIDGANAAFDLAHTPSPALSLQLFRGPIFQKQGTAYTLTGRRVVFGADYIPQTGEVLSAFFRYTS